MAPQSHTESSSSIPYVAWGISLLVLLLALFAWGSSYQWHLIGLSTYQVFPIFGLLAFSLMWSTYAVGISARYGWMGRQGLGGYYRVVGFAILAAIMLHPGLLIWQLWHDGFGLPPESYLQHYVAPSMRFAALVGSTCLLIFLAYEFHRWF
ncbi:MAG TPA: hypothetical protein VFL81_02105, partial [Candidatus Saccharimonadales bacterium]|nr:hypothetical protein [Candidatus Saccharimonadales bacterium]